MPRGYLVWWGYAVELLAAAATLIALCLWFGSPAVIAFVRGVAIDTATLFGAVMLAASLAFLWTFYSKADTDFYQWLDTSGALNTYLRATGYTVAVSLLSTLSLVTLKQVGNEEFSLLTIYLLILAIINLYTLVQNVLGLMQLNAKFNNARSKRD